MYTFFQVKNLQINYFNYFCYSLGYTYKVKTKEEKEILDKCINAMHNARLLYNINYRKYFEANP